MLSFWVANLKYVKADIFQKAKLNLVEPISVPQTNQEETWTKTIKLKFKVTWRKMQYTVMNYENIRFFNIKAEFIM